MQFLAPAGRLMYEFDWEAGRVAFRTSRDPAGSSAVVASHVFTSGVPAAGSEAVQLNFLRFRQSTLEFAVDPLYWQTWWFRIAAALTLSGGVLNLRFEERLADRNRIAQELHDTLLQGFLSASMQVHVAADILPADSGAKPILTRALQLMRHVIDEGRNAVRGLRSSASDSLDLEHAFARVPQELATGLETAQRQASL